MAPRIATATGTGTGSHTPMNTTMTIAAAIAIATNAKQLVSAASARAPDTKNPGFAPGVLRS